MVPIHLIEEYEKFKQLNIAYFVFNNFSNLGALRQPETPVSTVSAVCDHADARFSNPEPKID